MKTEHPKPQTVAVLTADVLQSRRYSTEDRQQVDRALREAFVETTKSFPSAIHTPLAFRITAGDEFQCVISDIPRAVDIAYYLRAVVATEPIEPQLSFRAAVGIGAIDIVTEVNPYEEDGPAFAFARSGLEDLYKNRHGRMTQIVTEDTELNQSLNAVLSLVDAVSARWSLGQWEAIRWSILGITREKIAELTQVAHQNVTKKLLAASWPSASEGLEFIRERLNERFVVQPNVSLATKP